MKGGQYLFKMPTSLRRAKVYFLIIALAMITTLFFLSYGWNFSEKIYRISINRSRTMPTRIVTISERSNNSSRLYDDTGDKQMLSNMSVFNNESLSFSKFVDPGSPNTKTISYDTVHNSELTDKQLEQKSDRIDSHHSINKSKLYTKSVPSEYTTDVRQQTILDLVKTVNIDSNTTRSPKDRHKSSEHMPNGKPNFNSSNTFINERKVLNGTYPQVLTLDNHIPSSRESGHGLGHVSKYSVNTGLVKQTADTVRHHINTTHSNAVHVTSISETISGDTGTNTLQDTLNRNKMKGERLTNGPGSQLGHEHSNAIKPFSTNGTSSASQQRYNTAHLISDIKRDNLNHSKKDTERRKNKVADGHRYETIGLKNRSARSKSVLDQLKYGLWNPVDLKRANRAGSPTVRPDGCQGCFKTDFKETISAPNICKAGDNVLAILLITSAPRNREARDVIRKTWGNVCYHRKSTIKCVFVFGEHREEKLNKDLASESELHKDIVQFAFHDSYANLTYKTMMSLRWASNNCQSATYVMKTDDDMYLNTELLPLLLQGAPNTKFFGGFCWGPSSPHRDVNSKWYVSFEQFSQPLYPKMCSGTGYVMTKDVALGVLKQSTDIPFFYLEDVYVSLCLKKLGIQPVLLAGFSNMKVDYEACAFRNRVVTSHSYSPRELQDIWNGAHGCPRDNLTPAMVFYQKYFR